MFCAQRHARPDRFSNICGYVRPFQELGKLGIVNQINILHILIRPRGLTVMFRCGKSPQILWNFVMAKLKCARTQKD